MILATDSFCDRQLSVKTALLKLVADNVFCFRCCPRKFLGGDATISGPTGTERRVRREETCHQPGWLTRYVHNRKKNTFVRTLSSLNLNVCDDKLGNGGEQDFLWAFVSPPSPCRGWLAHQLVCNSQRSSKIPCDKQHVPHISSISPSLCSLTLLSVVTIFYHVVFSELQFQPQEMKTTLTWPS
jgi:hypothetical protein